MDDYTWQLKLRQRQIRQRRQLFGAFLLAALAIGCAIWYFFIYIRTPEYAIKQINYAIEHQDSELFKRYVNVDVLANRAYDDLTVDLFAYDSTLTPKTKVMFEKFYLHIKPQLTEGLTNTTLIRVESGSWLLPDGTDILKGRQLGIDFERFLERSQVRNTTLKKIVSIEHEGTQATATIEIVEDYTQTPFSLQLAMEQAADGHWQVVYIKNYRDYLDKISPLQNGDIASYIDATKNIVEAYNADFTSYQREFKRLTKTADGKLSSKQRQKIADLIENNVLPALKKRQQKLDEIDIPAGARYLARQRQQSTETTIKAWQHYIKGLRENKPTEFDTAETLHKQELAIDLRIEDIIHHTAVSKNIPNLP